MQIVRDLAGYSWGRSDLVRRAMSKKKHDVMAREREYFVHGIIEDGNVVVPGAVRNGVSEKVANAIFDEMMDFASYAFNKSHAAAYAVVAYRTAYLKHYYPVEFMTALLNSFLGSAEKVTEYIYACKGRGIKVLAPDINKSFEYFSVDGTHIRFGLAAIRNVGENITRAIIENRQSKGAYKDFFDFVERIDGLNRRALEGMVKAGCFDSTGVKRSQLLAVCAQALDAASEARKRKESGQISLFEIAGAEELGESASIPLPDIPEFHNRSLLAMERESIGIYISGHPLLDHEALLKSFGCSAAELAEADGSGRYKEGSRLRIGGIVNAMRGKPTRSGSGIMGYGVLEDLSGSIEIAVFPSLFTKFRSMLEPDTLIVVDGKLNIRDDQPNTILVENVRLMEEMKEEKQAQGMPGMAAARKSTLYLRMQGEDNALFNAVCAELKRFPGSIPVVFYYAESGKKLRAPKELCINLSGGILEALQGLLGEENVKVKDG